jgi:hypothetical protein
MFLLSAVSASLGPAAAPDTVKTRRQLTLVCLVVFVSRLLFGFGVKNIEGKNRMDGTKRFNASLPVTSGKFNQERD